jgi:hypothetical protein
MTKKTLGYVELEWTCQRCGTKNPGTEKVCTGCGALMSDQDQFDLPASQELITDEEKLAKAAQGPDVHCPFCEARNPAGTKVCTQCGADLGEAERRDSGRVLGALQTEPVPDVPCPFCGTPNPANAAKCKGCGGNLGDQRTPITATAPVPKKSSSPKWLLILGGLFGVLVCIGLIAFLVWGSQTDEVTGMVQSVRWQRSVQIVEQRAVERQAWIDEIPAGSQAGSCTDRYRFTQSEPAPGAEEVCGTPYTIDQGSGMGQVVQDCEYRVYDDWCTYSTLEWMVVNEALAQGNDLSPYWPTFSLDSGQREGERSETYTVVFEAENQRYTTTIADANNFMQYQPGSRWGLKVNRFGGVTEINRR